MRHNLIRIAEGLHSVPFMEEFQQRCIAKSDYRSDLKKNIKFLVVNYQECLLFFNDSKNFG